MFAFYDLSTGQPVRIENATLQAFPDAEKPVWLHLTKPTEEECATVSALASIPPEHLHAALDFHERPRAEFDDDIVLVVARASVPQSSLPTTGAPFATCPIAIILTRSLVVTVCLVEQAVENLLNQKLMGKGERREERLVLSLLLRISTTFIKHLQIMNEQLDAMELALHESMHNKELVAMLHLEKGLIFFLTALKGNQAVLDKIRAKPPLPDCPECRALLDDVIIENKQATDMAEIFSQVIGSISDAFASIISNNLNKVMKLLTGLTIVFMIPTIIGGIYGMNVSLPMENEPYAFVGLCGICVTLSIAVFWFLRKKHWI
ncbi:magnesium transporter CorA family protein [Desulfovibrio sp. OttesenSCG-928-G15]|nr:magnesium transporter CorA family protein [Desulfovibrio sp. OttesenSCG-928-G15]